MKILSILLASILGLSLIACAQPQLAQSISYTRPADIRAVVGEEFILAFLRHAGPDTWAHIEVAVSKDNATWTDANFPEILRNQIRMKNISGVGVCGSVDRKTLMVVFNDKSFHRIYSVTGHVDKGNIVWGGLSMHPNADSDGAPSCAILDDGKSVIGMRVGSFAVANVYSPAASGNASLKTQAIPSVQASVSSSPVMAIVNNTVMMAWKSYSSTGCDQIELAQGVLSVSGEVINLTFSKLKTLTLTGHPTFKACATSAPAVFTDGQRFYIAVNQEQAITGGGDDALHGWGTVIYRSATVDLLSDWNEYRRIPLSVSNKTYIAGAAKETGEIAFGRVVDKKGMNNVAATILSGDSWHQLGRTPWINGGDASYKPFGLTRLGSNRTLISIAERLPVEFAPGPHPVK